MGLTKKQIIKGMTVAEARAALAAATDRSNKAMEKRNAAFARLSDARKRVTVAQDVIDQLRIRRFKAEPGNYLRLESDAEDKFHRFDDDGESLGVHEVLDGVKCHVCGIGSLFVAAVDRINQCTVGDMQHSYDNPQFMRDYLGEFFPEDQLVLIETAFEMDLVNPLGTGWIWESHPIQDAIKFGKKTSTNANKRLKHIMQNIVQHNGTFVP